jgi:hypothetical protein
MARKPWIHARRIVSRARFRCQEKGIVVLPFMINIPSVAVPIRHRKRRIPPAMIMGKVIQVNTAMCR